MSFKVQHLKSTHTTTHSTNISITLILSYLELAGLLGSLGLLSSLGSLGSLGSLSSLGSLRLLGSLSALGSLSSLGRGRKLFFIFFLSNLVA